MNPSKFWILCVMIPLAGILTGQGGVQAVEPQQILSIEAYDMMNTVPDTYLIDVRTRAEYQFVGHPVESYLFPYMFWSLDLVKNGEFLTYEFHVRNKDFVREIGKVFKKTDNLLLLSRDNARSQLAGNELMDAGFKNVYVIMDGFEGAPFPTFEDRNKDKFYRQLAKRNHIHGYMHRRHYGWQYWGLPWTYRIDPKYIYPPDLSSEKRGELP